MKTLLIILGISLYGTPGAALQKGPCCDHDCHRQGTKGLTAIYPDFEASLREQGQAEELDVKTLRVFQVEEDLDLGFDTNQFLPDGFDPYAGKIATWVDLGLNKVDEEEDLDLGFDTAPYLPAGFDPYKGMEPAWENIPAEAIQAALFHTGPLAPKAAPAADLQPGNSIGLDALGLIEVEEETDLGFDTAAYLPADFDPYLGMATDRQAMQ